MRKVLSPYQPLFLLGEAPSIENVEGSYPTVVQQASGRLVRVVQAYAYTKYLGRLNLTFNDDGEVTSASGNPVLIDKSFEKGKRSAWLQVIKKVIIIKHLQNWVAMLNRSKKGLHVHH